MTFAFIISIFSGLFMWALIMLVMHKQRKQHFLLKKRIEKLTIDEKKIVSKLVKPKSQNSFLSDQVSRLFGAMALEKKAQELSIAGVPLKAEEYFMIWLMSGVLLPLMCLFISKNIFVAIGISAFGLLIPPLALGRARQKRIQMFELQLSDALVVISNCLRSGFTFQQSLESITSEMAEPISKEFGKTLREVKLGLSMDVALSNMVRRLKHDDLELLVNAVVIQRQVGGNLAEILESIADTIKERLKIRSEIKVLTATGRMSGMVVGLLPVFMLAFLMVLNPSYVSIFFTTTIGMIMIGVAIALESIGFFIVNKIVNIKF
jgi:tight adherence protein B